MREVFRSEAVCVHPEKAVAIIRDLAHGREHDSLLPCHTSGHLSELGELISHLTPPQKKRPATAVCRLGRGCADVVRRCVTVEKKRLLMGLSALDMEGVG